jgi:exopolysaccharide biosynthesis polyprenyl glycosylphosphotransferase
VVLFRQAFLQLARHKVFLRNVLIIGAGTNGRNIAVNVAMHNYLGLRIVGYLDDEKPAGTRVFNDLVVRGTLNQLEECVDRFHVTEVIIALEQTDYSALMRILERVTRTNAIVKIASPLYEIIPARRFIEHYGSIPVVAVFQSNVTPVNEKAKRVFDLVASALFLLVQAPLFAVIALLVKLDSPGPVFYHQMRIGKNGRPFRFYKFRSMKVGSDADSDRQRMAAEFVRTKRTSSPAPGGSTKIVNERSVTRVGKWLRKLSLDELPQLWNVLRGEMSLVGPRPCLPYEWENYEEWHKQRMNVLPGCTGLWQVTSRSVVGFEDMVILDLHYIQNASLLLDLRLLVMTLPVMLFGTGAK